MEKKRFNEYSAKEKEALLMHWWYYYGKMLFTSEEYEMFNNYVLKDGEAIKDAAIFAFIAGESNQAMLGAMRMGKMDEFLDGIKKLRAEKISQSDFEQAEDLFLEEIVGTYNNPEEAVPMEEAEIKSQLSRMFGGSMKKADESILSFENVHKIFKQCSLNDKEIGKKGEPLVPFSAGEGVNCVVVFNSERLEKNRKAISQMIDELPRIDEGVSLIALNEDKNGKIWTGNIRAVEALVELGMATGELQFLLPREEWSALSDGLPFVIRNKEASEKDLVEYKPAEFKKVKTDYFNNLKRNGKTTQ